MIIRILISLCLLLVFAQPCLADFYADIVGTKTTIFNGPPLACVRQLLGFSWNGDGNHPSPIDLERVLRDLDKRLSQVPGQRKCTTKATIVAKFDISKKGLIANIVILKSSGANTTDESFTDTLQKISPIKPLPDGLPGLSLTLTFGQSEESKPKARTIFLERLCE